MKMDKSYKDLVMIQDYQERLEYLKCTSVIGDLTFGGHRQLNQMLYTSDEWKKTRQRVILRDDGCDLGHPDYPIRGPAYVHHINPITIDDILQRKPNVFDLNNLVCTSFQSHNYLHFGTEKPSTQNVVTRKPNDTCPWKE